MSIPPAKLTRSACARFAAISVSIAFCLCNFAGCGAPGEPVAPSPPVTVTITDLVAHQAGNGVQLTFTMPVRSVTGERLATSPAIEILRGSSRPDGSPDIKTLHVVDTIPASLVSRYIVGEKFQFTDPVSPVEIRSQESTAVRSPLIYAVRSRLTQKRASANSNVTSLKLVSVPEPIVSIQIHITEPTIELTWAPVNRAFAGDTLSVTPDHYNIYRAELNDADAEIARRDISQLNLNANLHLLASTPDTTSSDMSFEFGKTYVYIVRSVVIFNSTNIESSDSVPAIVSPKDTFPPATPQSVSAAVLPGEVEGSFVVDLSWSINSEADFAGYRVYRSEVEGTLGQVITPDLLPTPSYRDTSLQPPHRYWYSVAAVDRAGNESPPSSPVAADIAQPSP